MKKTCFFFLIILIFFSYQYGLFSFPGRTQDAPRIIAHRGDRHKAPENTLPAIRSAIESGADCIELDIRCTRDKIPVLFHDSNLRRLTGTDRAVSELECKDFLTFPLSVPSLNYPTATLCTLEEVLILCADNPDLSLHFELKVSGIEEKVVSLLQKYDSCCSYEICSKKPEVLKNVKLQNPDIKTFLLLSSGDKIYDYLFHAPDHIDGISVKSKYVTAALATVARIRGHKIYVWTVNERFHAKRFYHLGVDGIITDNPASLRKMLS